MKTNWRPLCLLIGAAVRLSFAAEPAAIPATNAPLKQLSPNEFEIGKVHFDKSLRSVTFPAALNLNNGVVEYLLVTRGGKVHESVLSTEAQPAHIHLAMLLLGAKGVGTNAYPQDVTRPVPGDPVSVEVSWLDEGGRQKRVPGEELVFNRKTNSKASKGTWIYNGSRVFDGTFIAQQDGSIIAVVGDFDALINNPRPGHENDEIWVAEPQGLPPLNWPMQVTIRLGSTPAKP